MGALKSILLSPLRIASIAGFHVRVILVLCLAATQVGGAEPTAPGAADPPAWAYPVNPPDFKPAVDDGSLRHVPGSTRAYTLSQLRDFFMAPDWHPGDHPVMPDVVAVGRKSDVYACGFCHRADGRGGPENASIAGLPAGYIVQQMADFKSGARKSSVPSRLPVAAMTTLSVAASAAEIHSAAAYFSALKPAANITVVETAVVPKSYVTGWHLAALPGSDGTTIACAGCHGSDLRGLGAIPPLAGRSPTYLVRQLYDFKHGARAGSGSFLMKPAVERLEIEDMVSIAAYAASLPP